MLNTITEQLFTKPTDSSTNYKAIIRGKNDVRNKSLCLGISISHRENDYLKTVASINLLGKTASKACIILGDILHRHNLKLFYPNISDDEAYEISVEIGKKWHKTFAPVIEAQNIDIEVIHWDTWLNDPEFPFFHKYVIDLYKTDSEMRKAVSDFINQYKKRLEKYNIVKNIEAEESIELYKKYVLEETAASILWNKKDIEYLLYPSAMPPSLELQWKYKMPTGTTNNIRDILVILLQKQELTKEKTENKELITELS